MSAMQKGPGPEGKAPAAGPGSESDADSQDAADLHGIVAQLRRAARGQDRVSLGDLVDAMGRSSMAAVLLVPALLLVSPLSGVPGASIMGGLVIALIAGQVLLQRQKVWLPGFIRSRSLPGDRLRQALAWLRKPAERFDGLAPARPGGGDDAWWTPVLALICLCLGLAMPMMELIPFSSSIAATVVAALALSMLTGRLIIALVALVAAGLAVAGVFWLL